MVKTENCRPYLVIQKGNHMIIIDVTVSFDNGLDAFTEAQAIKITKYANLTQEHTVDGRNATVEAVVVGHLADGIQ